MPGSPEGLRQAGKEENLAIHLWASWPYQLSGSAEGFVCLGVQPSAQAANQPITGLFQTLEFSSSNNIIYNLDVRPNG